MSITYTHPVCTDYISQDICAIFALDKAWPAIVADSLFAFGYVGAACVLLYFILCKNHRPNSLLLLLAAFFFLCGIHHTLSLFAVPSYVLALKDYTDLVTAIILCILLYRMYSADLRSSQFVKGLFVKKSPHDKIKPTGKATKGRLQERILRDCTDSADVGMLVLDHLGTINIANTKACEILGYKKKEIENTSITGVFDEEFLDANIPVTASNAESHTTAHSKTLYGVHHSGAFIPLEVSLKQAKFDADILFVSLRDIGDQLETEQALVSSQSITDNILSNLPMGIHIYEFTHHTLTLITDNQMARTLLGSDSGFFLSDERLSAMMKEKALSGEGTIRTTLSRYNHNAPQNLRLYLFMASTSELVVMFEDITLQQQYETQLIKQESMTRQAINASIAGVYIIDTRKGESLFINDRFTAITGYNQDDLKALKSGIFGLIHPDDRTRMAIHLRHIFRDKGKGETFSIQYRVQHAKGHWLWVIGQDVIFERNNKGKLTKIIGSFLDITPLKTMQDKLLTLKDKAEEANRLKTEFLANMSHEIRTPMNAIIALTDMVLDMDMADNQREYLQKVQLSSRSLLQLLNDILDYSKLEAGKFDINNEPFDLYRLLSNVLHLFQTTAIQKGLSIKASIDDSVPRFVIGDASRIAQILNNLLGNAIKFTEKGDIKCRALATLNSISQTYIVSFVVEDTGIGIEDDKLTALFKSFSQADSSIGRRFGGTGLGLSISRRLAHLLNGDLTVSSTIGKGSTFTLAVPLVKNILPENQASRVKPYTNIVIVSDQLDIQAVLESALLGKNKQVLSPLDSGLDHELKNSVCDILVVDLTSLKKSQRPKIMQKLPTFSLHQIKTGIIILHTEDDIAGHKSHNQLSVPVCWLCAPFLIPDIEDAHQYLRNKISSISGINITTDGLIRFTNTRILLVEDNTTNQFVAKALLAAIGISVVVANNGEEGVREFKRASPDLVLMDLQMPIMDGFTAAAKIRALKTGKHVPIFAMSAAVMAPDKERVIAAGMDGHIPKPIVRDTFYQTLAKALPDNYQNVTVAPNSSPSLEPVNAIQQALTESLHEFAVDAAVQRLGNSLPIYTGLLENFFGHLQEISHQLTEEPDNESLRRYLHTLKGLSRSVGAMALAELAEENEDALISGTPIAIPVLIDAINEVTDKVGTALDQVLPLIKRPTTKAHQSLDQLIDQLSCRVYIKVEDVEPYARVLAERFGDEKSRQIMDAISKLDYQCALKLMSIDTHN
ncbi:PAS domain S-box protein [Alteromonas sp. 14N.309.X.WAT.G.H12]|uniref:PAS domain S-box protein n=1 Tax=Alteromonas sp. 14N.309.X.WAT.G.H12 TaxID=3120824 RepID=UPI002FD2C11B